MGPKTHIDARVAALEAVYRAYCRRVRWMLRARGVRDDALDDVAQDVFLAIHRRLPTRDPEVPMDAWVMGIACNTAFSHRRASARQLRRGPPRLDPIPPPDPEQELERRAAWHALREFLDGLAAAQREVFVLADLLGMTMPEIADTAKVPLNTLYSRLRLARARFESAFAGVRAGADLDRFVRRAAEGAEPTADEHRRAWARVVAALPWGVPAVGAGAVATVVLALGIGAGAIAVTARAPVAPPPSATDVAARPGAARPVARLPDLPAPAAPAAVTTVVAPPTEPPTRRARTPAAAAVPDPADELAFAVAVLEDAKLAVRRGDPRAALAEIARARDRLRVGPLAREVLRIERQAACDAGATARAQAAFDELARAGLVAPGAPVCP